MLAGLNGGDATQSVIALAAGALNPPAGAAWRTREGLTCVLPLSLPPILIFLEVCPDLRQDISGFL